MTPDDVRELERVLAAGGIALFPADTVYGLAVDPGSESAVARLYELKGRPPARPSAVMFFDRGAALEELGWLGPRTREAAEHLLPGPVTLVLPNPERRWPLACGPEPERVGVRVPALEGALEPLRAATGPVLQSSANPSGGPDARRLADVDERIRAGVDIELDGGELPGTPSTVIDLSTYEAEGSFDVLREGVLPKARVVELLA
ncbi:MAG TPA: L-threonylcarbamoyladenylate synthase [Thermoleophilaceae bacterium]